MLEMDILAVALCHESLDLINLSSSDFSRLHMLVKLNRQGYWNSAGKLLRLYAAH